MSKTELSNKHKKDNAAVRASVTNNKKAEYDGAYLGHTKPAEVPEKDKANFSGKDSRVKVHETTGPDGGATVHSLAPRAPGASPLRVRFSEPKLIKENGSSHIAHVTDATKE